MLLNLEKKTGTIGGLKSFILGKHLYVNGVGVYNNRILFQ